MKRVAIPANGRVVSSHFGHCVSFKIFNIDNNEIIDCVIIDGPNQHMPGVLPQLLQKHGVEVVIADGIGQKAIGMLKRMGVEVFTGVSGLIEEVMDRFLNGVLQEGANGCDH